MAWRIVSLHYLSCFCERLPLLRITDEPGLGSTRLLSRVPTTQTSDAAVGSCAHSVRVFLHTQRLRSSFVLTVAMHHWKWCSALRCDSCPGVFVLLAQAENLPSWGLSDSSTRLHTPPAPIFSWTRSNTSDEMHSIKAKQLGLCTRKRRETVHVGREKVRRVAHTAFVLLFFHNMPPVVFCIFLFACSPASLSFPWQWIPEIW